MSDFSIPVPPEIPAAPPLTQVQRVLYTFTAPSKTFTDVKRNNSWWLPLLITIVTGLTLWSAITTKITWQQVYENNQQSAPKWAKDMQEKAPAEQRAAQEKIGPITQEITWALSPIFLFIIDAAVAGIFLATINFGFGGKARFFDLLSVTLYANLVSWVPKFLISTVAIFAGLAPESFNVNNIAGTNVAFYLSQTETPKLLYTLLLILDPLVIWNLIVTAIGVSIVAGTKRNTGYIAVFGWWALVSLIFLGLAAI